MKRSGLVLGFAAVALAGLSPNAAHAAQSVSMRLSNGTANTCTVTALAPKMTSTSRKTMTTSATVRCTGAATVTVTIGAVELDGSTEDATVQAAERSYTVSVRAGVTVTVSGPSFTCVSTEPDNEELATKARVAFSSTVVSPVDRTVPTDNQFAC